jgi:tetratricopeptide (TPR) repeat protein
MSEIVRCTVVLGLTLLFCVFQAAATPSSQSASAERNGSSTQSMAPRDQGAPTSYSGASAADLDPVGEATVLYRNGNLDAALAKYKELLRERPKSPDACAGLIRVHLRQRDVEQAAQTANECLALVDSPRVRVAYGEVLFRQGKIEQAELEWAKAINAGFAEARAYLGLARVRNARAMYKSARGMINRAHELDPNDPEIEGIWVAALTTRERIQYLEDELATRNDWNNEKHQDTVKYVQYLKEQEKADYRPCRFVNGTIPTVIPMVMILGEDTFMKAWGLPVFLNGHRSSLLIDTGASGIVLSRKAAERAGIVMVAADTIGGIGDKGRRSGHIGIADVVQIGDLQFQGCPIEIVDSRSVMGNDGLIGSDVFKEFLVDLDFPSVRLRLSPLPQRPDEAQGKPRPQNSETDKTNQSISENDNDHAARATEPSSQLRELPAQDAYIAPEMQSFTRVFRFGDDLLIPTTIGNVPGKLFLLDTGAFNNAISPEAAREVTKIYGDSNKTVKGLGGSVKKVYSANKVVVTFGHLRQENQDMVGFDTSSLSDEYGTEVSGFLGFKMLMFLDIKIDYRDALVEFSYNPERWKHWPGQ